MECSICIETKDNEQFFKCNACKYTTCVDCNKIYLLSSTQDPHCINCRAVIPYDIFLDKFNEKWIFNKYKKHRYDVLWDREKSLIPQTIHHIGLKNKEKEIRKKQDLLYEQIKQLQIEISNLNINSKKNNTKFNYTYACPKEKCKGFLNKDYICEVCLSLICKNCYVEVNQEYKDQHECDPELVETFNTIKKEAKPCPSCGEFISKINGCDQMFCTTCGTGFSWKTGMIEKGVIHNPHAHAFFQNNPDAQQNYLNALNGNNGNNGCRNPIPTHIFMEVIFNIDKSLHSNLTTIHRRVSEFRQYYRNRFLAILQNNNDHNLDIRLDYINNIKDEKKIKQDLHRRDKKVYFKKQITQLMLYAYDIAEIIFWNFHDAIPEKYLQKNIHKNLNEEDKSLIISISEKHLNLINEIISDTNASLRNISDKFNYTTLYLLDKDFRAPYLS
jgi:hypothetical protein